MNAITESAKRLFSSEQGDVAARVGGLDRAVRAGRGRLDDHLLDEAGTIVERAGERLRLSGAHTIVALAGATGSGKSSIFNWLTGLDLAGVGVRRPTTSWALACAWGPEGAGDILEWMGIPARHQVSRMSMLDSSSDDTNLEGLVLLDLPDHDSTEVSHHLEVDRLVTHADLLVWVLDPQKYADAVIHERYLRPLSSHSDVTMVVLNQLDRIPTDQRQAALQDVERLLVADGLVDVPVLGISAVTGEGVDDFKRALAKRIRAKEAVKERLTVDVRTAAERMTAVSGAHPAPGIDESDWVALDETLAQAAGVPVVVAAIEKSTTRRAGLATGWPLARWLGRLRSDPLKRLEVESDISMSSLARSSVPEATKVQRASVEVAVRDLADKSSQGLSPAWVKSVRNASTAHSEDLTDALDQAVVGTDLGVAKPALWWRLVNVLQWALLLAAAGGLGWLVALAFVSFLNLNAPNVPGVVGVPVPTLLLAVGLVFGIALALLSRLAAQSSGRRKAARADRLMRDSIGQVAQSRVIEPIRTELEAYETARSGLATAIGSTHRRSESS